VLFERLSFDLKHGTYDKDRFMEYLKLPRAVHYMLAAIILNAPSSATIARNSARLMRPRFFRP